MTAFPTSPDPSVASGQTPLRAALGEVGSLVSLAAPLVAGLVASTGIVLVDTAMLGPLGAVPLAAVAVASSVIILFYAGLYGFVGPVGLLAGQRFGAGEPAEIGRVARHGFVLALGAGTGGALLMAGILLLLAPVGQPPEVIAVIGPYWLLISLMLIPWTLGIAGKNLLDATDRPWTGVLLTLVPVALNILFNWVFIYGHLGMPALGLTGAGLASFLAQTLGTAALWIYVRFAPGLRAWWTAPRLSRADFRRQLREALPMSAQYFMEGGAVALAGLFIGFLGVLPLAGNQVALSVGSTLYMLPLGMAASVSIRVSQAIGAKERSRLAPIGYAGLGVVTLWMGLFSVLFLLMGGQIAALFVSDPAVIAAAASIFFVFGITQLMDGIQSVSLGALRGMLDNRWPTQVSLIAYWLLALPLAWLIGLELGFGAPGVWAGFGIGLAVAAVMLGWRFHRMTRMP
jgi:MATE family multidrug resistance protein